MTFNNRPPSLLPFLVIIAGFFIVSSGNMHSKIDQDETALWFVSDCDRNVTFNTDTANGNAAGVGIISSPGYPESYPMPGTVCKYTFSAVGSHAAKTRVQIIFADFDLKTVPSAGQKMCDQHDHIRISFPAAPTNPLKFCGKTRPYAVMSPTPSLDLFFISEPASAGMPATAPTDGARGYQFQYRFMQEEKKDGDADIGGTQQPSDLDGNKHKGCEFRYRSWHASNGSFSSVNHPGFYPRNVKCIYHFIGRVNERVMLVFGFFDVRSSATDCSDGDYIQIDYPNYDNTVNQRSLRYCSTKRPVGNIFSSYPHLILSFHTDGRDDGRGFDGYYQFVNSDEVSIQEAGAQRLLSTGSRIEGSSRPVVGALLLLMVLSFN